MSLSRGGTISSAYAAESAAAVPFGYDQFVGYPAGTRLQDAIPLHWKEYQRAVRDFVPTQDFRWEKVVGSADFVFENNLLDPETVDYFRITPSAQSRVVYKSSLPATPNFRLSGYVKVAQDATFGSVGFIVCADASFSNYIEVRHLGSARVRQFPTSNGIEQAFTQDSGAIVTQNRMHYFELECNEGVLSVYCDQRLLFSGPVVNTGRYFGLAANGASGPSGVWFEDVKVEEFYEILRVYTDVSFTGGTNAGTYENPYQTWAAFAATQTAANHTPGTRYCFKAGVRIPQNISLGANVSNASYWPYECNTTATRWVVASLANVVWTSLGSGRWSFPMSGRTLPGTEPPIEHQTTQQPVYILEDGIRVNGTTLSNITDHVDIYETALGYGLYPTLANLQPGQWAYDYPNQRVVYMPSSGNIANHTVEVSTSQQHAVYVHAPFNLHIEGVEAYGALNNKGAIYQDRGGDGYTLRRSIGRSSDRGVTIGSEVGTRNDNPPNLKNATLEYNESYDVAWKGVSTSGAVPWKGNDAPWFIGCLSRDIGQLTVDAVDCEGLMTTPGTEDANLLWCKSTRIGLLNEIRHFPAGVVHPVGFSIDGGNAVHMNGCRTWQTRTVLRVTATEGATPTDLNAGHITDFYCGNMLSVDCGVPNSADPSMVRSNALVEIGTFEDRNRSDYPMTPPPLTMSGVLIENVTDVGGKYGIQYGFHETGMIAGQTANQSNPTRNSGSLQAVFRNYVFDQCEAAILFHYGSESTLNVYVDIDTDYGVINYTGVGTLIHSYRHKCQPCGNQRQAAALNSSATPTAVANNLAALIGRADGVTNYPGLGTVELGTRDANTTLGNPLLNASYQPQVGSPAINKTAVTTLPKDILWRIRTNNTAGAFEAE